MNEIFGRQHFDRELLRRIDRSVEAAVMWDDVTTILNIAIDAGLVVQRDETGGDDDSINGRGLRTAQIAGQDLSRTQGGCNRSGNS